MIKVGSDFSGVGAFDQALIRLGIKYKTIFSCDMDKYARQTYIENYGEPDYYPADVYEREIPKQSLDIYMTSPPCQAFSMAGKRLGKEDKRGILFFNSYEFIQKNKPRYFIFENVKGLLSHDNGKTFQEWINYLGGKSINGLPVLFPDENAVPYHLYYKVLNSKKLNVPQNRERIFIIGIRDDKDNYFRWPKDKPLTKKLKNVLEKETHKKYYLSEKAIVKIKKSQANKDIEIKKFPDASRCIIAGYYKMPFDGQYIKIKSATKTEDELANCLRSNAALCPTDNTLWIADIRMDEGLRKRKNLLSPCLKARNSSAKDIYTMSPLTNYSGKVRRLTPRECFRLMDFPDTFTWTCSDSQAYKQAGNSIVVKCLEKIIEKFKL